MDRIVARQQIGHEGTDQHQQSVQRRIRRLGGRATGGEDGGSRGATDLQGRVDKRAGRACVLMGGANEADVLHGRYEQTQPEPEELEFGRHVRPRGDVHAESCPRLQRGGRGGGHHESAGCG